MGTKIVAGCLVLLISVLVFMAADSEAISHNITRGSMISTSSPNHTTYWTSPSTNFAFGIYPINSHRRNNDVPQYVIGIWLANSCQKTLVWSLYHLNSPLKGTNLSILFDQDGFFKLRVDDGDRNHTQLLLRKLIRSPAQYASMQDNGNFIVYDSNSNIIWQSFDYRTDTILPGQVVKSGHNLISKCIPTGLTSCYLLTMEKNENLVIYNVYGGYKNDVWTSRRTGKTGLTQLRLDSYGNLDIVDHNGVVIDNLYKEEMTKEREGQLEQTLHRAVLGSDGILHLHRDTLGGCDRKSKRSSVVVWRTRKPPAPVKLMYVLMFIITREFLLYLAVVFALCVTACNLDFGRACEQSMEFDD